MTLTARAGSLAGMGLANLIDDLSTRYAYAGVALWPHGEDPVAVASGDVHGKIRVASVSKVVTAGVANAAGIGPLTDMSDALGFPLRHPDHPGDVILAGEVAAHHAGLSDAGGYVPPEGATLQQWMSRRESWGERPNSRFSYANLGYVLLAAAAERASGRRFGDLARDWLRQRGIAGGFNWWGVEDRTAILPAVRPDGDGGWTDQVDGEVAPLGLVGPGGEVVRPPKPGEAPWLWSPQGGLRTSLMGCLGLARQVSTFDRMPLWSPILGPHDGPDDVYQSWGFGLQLLTDPPEYPVALAGHFGDAYGVRAGVWWDAKAKLAFAYILNGVAERHGPDADSFTEDERAIFAAVARERENAR